MELTLPGFLAALYYAVYFFYPQSLNPSQTTSTPQLLIGKRYDFVIVGAGSAGCVLANRLTEIPNWNVLLIEAGGSDNAFSDAPLLHPYLRKTALDWNYTTVKQSDACLSKEGLCPYPRGRAMGGSSTINAMFYVRGNKADYDGWARNGNTGWSYKDVLPYFKKAENNREPSFANSFYHGTEGPMSVQYARYKTDLREMFLDAAEEFGWERGDYNGERQDVAGYLQSTIDGPSRENTAKAYLKPIRHRKNLKIIKHSVVTKVIIENQIAKGVEYYRNGKKYTVLANKEVIVSAGSINTPKLLMLSGIGPKDELEKHNIQVKADLPVGKNLQDHLQFPIFFEIDKNITITTDVWRTTESINEYTKKRTGPLTTTGAEAMVFFNTHNKSEQPNIQFTLISTVIGTIDSQNKNIMMISICNVKPNSVGTVKLRSSDWKDAPLIDPNYLSDKRDTEALRKGGEQLFGYMKTPTMSNLSSTHYTGFQPACEGKAQEEFIDCAIREYSATIYHPVGTAKMGPTSDKEAVVCPRLQVHGINNLRIVDASVMPFIPGGNTNAPVVMIAEKASDIIKSFYRNRNNLESL